MAFSAPAPLDDPVLNGDFEAPFIPDTVSDAVSGTPADECIGVGHQVLYGEDSWQHKIVDEEDPAAALEQITSDPVHEATFLSGYGYCVFSNEEGEDLAWVHLFGTANKPNGWAVDTDASTEFGYDLPGDDDPFNRAAMFTGGEGSVHNLWQAFNSPHQAYSGNHQTFEVDVFSGEIPAQASVQISLSATPLETPSPWVVAFLDCQLIYNSKQLSDGLQDGRIVVDPIHARFDDRSDDCADAKARWDAAENDPEERREILGQLRMIQLSFWRWNLGDEDVVIDNVGMTGATVFVEEI